MKGHRDLVAWQKAMELVVEIYRVTQGSRRMSYTDSRRSSGVLRYPFRAIWLKGTAAIHGRIFKGLLDWPSDRFSKSRLSSKFPTSSVTSQTRHCRTFSVRLDGLHNFSLG